MQETNVPTNDNDSQITSKRRTKLDIAREKLPQIADGLRTVLQETIDRVGDIVDLDTLATHLAFAVRERRTQAATSAGGGIEVGQAVRIVFGPHGTTGQVGTVVSAKRVRIHVKCADGRVHYLFCTDVEPVDVNEVAVDDDAPETQVEEQPILTAVGE